MGPTLFVLERLVNLVQPSFRSNREHVDWFVAGLVDLRLGATCAGVQFLSR